MPVGPLKEAMADASDGVLTESYEHAIESPAGPREMTIFSRLRWWGLSAMEMVTAKGREGHAENGLEASVFG